MIEHTFCRTMAAYNTWMNERLYACARRLSDDERKRDRGAFFRSIHSTLNHILAGDRFWLGRFTGRDYGPAGLGTDLYDDFDALAAERSAMDAEITRWAAGVDRAALSAPFVYVSVSDGVERRAPTWLVVTHLFNHQTHHRGQVTTLLMQAGIDPGVTDLPKMPGLDAVT